MKSLKKGDKIRLLSLQQLLSRGLIIKIQEYHYTHSNRKNMENLVPSMVSLLGTLVTFDGYYGKEPKHYFFNIKECTCTYYPWMIDPLYAMLNTFDL